MTVHSQRALLALSAAVAVALLTSCSRQVTAPPSLTASEGSSTVNEPQTSSGKPLVLTVGLVREVRVREVVSPRTEDLAYPQKELMPGLHLELRVPLAPGRLLRTAPPRDVRAVDSTGCDLLTRAPRRTVGNESLPPVMMWSDVRVPLAIVLPLPSPQATSVSIAMTTDLTICDGFSELSLPVRSDWTPIDHPQFTPLRAEYRYISGPIAGVQFRPRAVEAIVHRVDPPELRTGQGRGAATDTASISYYLPRQLRAGENIQVRLRDGVRTVKAVLDARDIPLPE